MPPAVADFRAICDYLESHENATLAHRVARTIYGGAQSCDISEGRQAGKDPDTRELVIQRYPYIIVYHPKADAVEIWRVLHTGKSFHDVSVSGAGRCCGRWRSLPIGAADSALRACGYNVSPGICSSGLRDWIRLKIPGRISRKLS